MLQLYIHSAAAMHNRHFLGHNQSPLLQNRLVWLLIINSKKGVNAGTCNQKQLETMHLVTAGRVGTSLMFRAKKRCTCGHNKKMKNI